MEEKLEAPLFDLVHCLSEAVDLVSPVVASHHLQVAYIALRVATEENLPEQMRHQLVLAGCLHDIGALSLQERLDVMSFEIEAPHHHAQLGNRLLNKFKPLAVAADLIHFHHVPWDSQRGGRFNGQEVPEGSHILHLADRVAVQIDKGQEVLSQSDGICQRIFARTSDLFNPWHVQAFAALAERESFWFDIISPKLSGVLSRMSDLGTTTLKLDDILDLSQLFAHVIDFRSPFTATHSCGVAAVAEELARLIGLSETECVFMRVAGYLHDLGKLAVPKEILEKPAPLSKEEFDRVKSHAFHTYRILESVPALHVINEWASFHHERYSQELPLGSRVMAVADVFTALTEERPYRKGMKKDNVIKTLDSMGTKLELDPAIVSIVLREYDAINASREAAQAEASEAFGRFSEEETDTNRSY